MRFQTQQASDSSTDLSANITRATISTADISTANISTANIPTANISNANITLANISNLDIDGVPSSKIIAPTLYQYGATGNGVTDDTGAFNLALADVASGIINVIVIPHGNFLLSGKIEIQNPVTVFGQGGTILSSASTSELFDIVGNNITFESLTFDGSRCQTSTSSFFVGHGANFKLLNSNFINIPGEAPSNTAQGHHACVLDCSSAYIAGNYVQKSGGDSINCNGGVYTVVNNKINNSGDGGVAFNNGASGVISGNIITYCNLGVGAGPEGNTSDSDVTSNQMIISGNKFVNCNYAINLGWYNYAGRLAPTNFIISNNTIKGCGSRGVNFDGNGGIFTGGTVSGNNIISMGQTSGNLWPSYDGDIQGIRIISTSGFIIADNCILDAKISGVTGISAWGSDITIIGNAIIGDVNGGVSFTNGININGSTTRIVCTGNNLKSAGNITGSPTNSLINNNNVN